MLPKVKSTVHTYKTFDGKKIKFRPMRIADEQALLEAKESKDDEVISRTILQVVENNLVTPEDAEKLPVFDVFRLLLQLKAISSGNVVETRFACTECTNKVDVDIDISDVEIRQPKKLDPSIFIGKSEAGEDIVLHMTYPTLYTMLDSESKTAISSYIKSISEGENYTDTRDEDQKELQEWVEDLNSDILEKLSDWVNNVPHLYKEISYTCSKCNQLHTVKLEKFEDFFMQR